MWNSTLCVWGIASSSWGLAQLRGGRESTEEEEEAILFSEETHQMNLYGSSQRRLGEKPEKDKTDWQHWMSSGGWPRVWGVWVSGCGVGCHQSLLQQQQQQPGFRRQPQLERLVVARASWLSEPGRAWWQRWADRGSSWESGERGGSSGIPTLPPVQVRRACHRPPIDRRTTGPPPRVDVGNTPRLTLVRPSSTRYSVRAFNLWHCASDSVYKRMEADIMVTQMKKGWVSGGWCGVWGPRPGSRVVALLSRQKPAGCWHQTTPPPIPMPAWAAAWLCNVMPILLLPTVLPQLHLLVKPTHQSWPGWAFLGCQWRCEWEQKSGQNVKEATFGSGEDGGAASVVEVLVCTLSSAGLATALCQPPSPTQGPLCQVQQPASAPYTLSHPPLMV